MTSGSQEIRMVRCRECKNSKYIHPHYLQGFGWRMKCEVANKSFRTDKKTSSGKYHYYDTEEEAKLRVLFILIKKRVCGKFERDNERLNTKEVGILTMGVSSGQTQEKSVSRT